MNKYTKGENYIFNEDGIYFEVTLLEDLSDEEWVKYRLKGVKLLANNSSLIKLKDPEMDTEFTVSRRKGEYAGYGNWYLQELGSTPYG